MTLQTLGKCSWDSIAIGEVFAYNACWVIGVKESKNSARLLTSDDKSFQESLGQIIKNSINWDSGTIIMGFLSNFWLNLNSKGSSCGLDHLYKLPLKVQRLWRCDE